MSEITNNDELSLKKQAFVKAYEKTLGNVTASCDMVGMSRNPFYQWMKNDPIFKAEIENVNPNELIADKAEHALMKKIDEGDTTAIIFTCKTKAKHRGYVERQEVMTQETTFEELLRKP